VTYLSLLNSTLAGHSNGAAIYLEAESGHNLIKNNRIDVTTSSRELLAVDGSAGHAAAAAKRSSLN
jgi:hypothetical protein